jgi:hypothetical protein
VKTEVDVKVWIDGTSWAAHSIVCTSDPGVGNGISFDGLSSEQQEQLKTALEKVETEQISQSGTGDATPTDLFVI